MSKLTNIDTYLYNVVHSKKMKIKQNLFQYRNKKILNQFNSIKNIGNGKKCFILATGPSINTFDLLLLQNKECIAVSSFYKHEHYKKISPRFHIDCPSHLPYTKEDWLRYYQDFSMRVNSNTTYMFGLKDKIYIDNIEGFRNSNILYYIDYGSFDTNSTFDFEKGLPAAQTGTVKAILLALYAGYSEIYLLGVDHNYISDQNYKRFYGGESAVGSDKKSIGNKYHFFWALYEIWKQYSIVNEMALKRNIRIFNLNPQSELDIFQFGNYASVLKES